SELLWQNRTDLPGYPHHPLRFEASWQGQLEATFLSRLVPDARVVLVKCVAAVGAIAFSSWCAVVVVVAAGLQQIHSFDANGYAQQDY
ncbi:unnamed protein product, partial [Closterium sp. NIES-54]